VPASPSSADLVFAIGLPFLTANGVRESDARSLLGLARRDLGNDGAAKLVTDMVAEKPVEPRAWISAATAARKAGAKRGPPPLPDAAHHLRVNPKDDGGVPFDFTAPGVQQ
jgi:hypothetical protein